MRKVTFPFLKTLVIVFGVLLLATNVALAQIPVSLPHIVTRAGGTRIIDVTVGELTESDSVLSYQFDLSYDPAVINIIGYGTTGTISQGVSSAIVVISTPGIVRVAVANNAPLVGSGKLLTFTTQLVAPGTSPLALTGFKFNEGTPASVPVDGQVEIPTFSVSLPPLEEVSVDRVTAFNIPITADEITGKGIQSYEFTVSYDTTLIVVTGVNKVGTVSEGIAGILVNTGVAGQVSVAASALAALVGADGATLINLQARVKAHADGTSALTFDSFQYNEGVPAVGAIDGSVKVHDITAIKSLPGVPTQFGLDQNYPNPFNPTTTITFGLPKESNVTLEVYNILGMKVRTLIAGERMNAAKYSVDWDGKDNSGMSVPSGIYLYRLHTDKFDAAKKMVLMK